VKFRHRILLDRVLAAPVAFGLNLAARVLGRVLRRDHSVSPDRTHRIVVGKLVGMGSAIQATPLLRALRARFPAAHIIFLTMRENAELVRRLDHVDEVMTLDDSSVLRMGWTTGVALWRLSRHRVDHFLDLEVYSAFTCIFALCCLARNRLGFYRHSARFKHGVYTHMVYFNTRMPVRRLYLQLARLLGAAPEAVDDSLGRIRIEPAEHLTAREKLAVMGINPDEPYVVINPNASDLLVERRWPGAYVVDAAVRIASEPGHQVVLSGARSERPYVQGLWESIPELWRDRVANSAGRLSLGELLAVIDGAACVLTNDTGPMHMALALSRPTVCLFGPGHPDHYGIERTDVASFYAAVPCSPCLYEVDVPPCGGNNICMQRITADAVVSQVRRLLSRGRSRGILAAADRREAIDAGRNAIRLPIVWDDRDGTPLGSVVSTRWVMHHSDHRPNVP
jgi:ADP-heptose:LPS heptosyltransferase